VTPWQRWVRRPHTLLFRRVAFQVHLWAGLGLGIYVFVICASGSVLVYRNELFKIFSPRPMMVNGSGPSLPIEDLKRAAGSAHPGYEITDVRIGKAQNQAVEVRFKRADQTMRRLVSPFTGEDLGDPLPAGFRLTAWLIDFHDNLLHGRRGRQVNGVAAILLVMLSLTGAIVWWPGSRRWRRSLVPDLRLNWKHLNWTLHSALGFWFFGFILMWAVTGTYLSFPSVFADISDRLEPPTDANAGQRIVDWIQYWLAYLHFGRLGGRGIPGCGRGLCDSFTKAAWALFGFVPPVMFITGAVMWWNRVLRPRSKKRNRESAADRQGRFSSDEAVQPSAN
jgi:uncharacterized iron-regulated membrane protein